MARININEFSAQAGGLAYRANQVRTDPAVVKAAQDAWSDVKTPLPLLRVGQGGQRCVAAFAQCGPGDGRARLGPHRYPDPGPSPGSRLVAVGRLTRMSYT